MTWTVLGLQDGYVHVGADGVTNPYTGDTAADQYLPLLCVNVDFQPAPSNIYFDFYNGWVRGALRATDPVQGLSLTSQARADEICAQTFGLGYRMAEFHDGRYGSSFEYPGGWTFWGAGSIAPGTRFWTAINDQPANPWNPAGEPQSMGDILSSIDRATLENLIRNGSEEEVTAFLTPTANQIADYVLARYGEDIHADIAGHPEAAVVLGVFLYGKEHGITAEDIDAGWCVSAKAADPFGCFVDALDNLIGLGDIRAIYRDFTHGATASSVVGAVKRIAKRAFWGISIGLAVIDLIDCMDWW